MWPSVRSVFQSFNARFEGACAFMYLDVKRLVTVAVGNLVDPIDAALGLPFVHPGGAPASRDEIAAAWHAVKARTDLARMGGGAFSSVTTIRLTSDGIGALVGQRLALDEEILVRRFKAFPSWPADAQLGLLSMAWAMGAGIGTPAAGDAEFPAFSARCDALDFAGAASECRISTLGNPGVAPRNLADVKLFLAADATLKAGIDPSILSAA